MIRASFHGRLLPLAIVKTLPGWLPPPRPHPGTRTLAGAPALDQPPPFWVLCLHKAPDSPHPRCVGHLNSDQGHTPCGPWCGVPAPGIRGSLTARGVGALGVELVFKPIKSLRREPATGTGRTGEGRCTGLGTHCGGQVEGPPRGSAPVSLLGHLLLGSAPPRASCPCTRSGSQDPDSQAHHPQVQHQPCLG